MSPAKPEDWPRVFEQHLNAGDLEATLALYDREARFVAPSGETLAGHDGIRPVLAGLIGAGTRFQSRVVKAVVSGEIAVLYTDFSGTTRDARGETVPIRSAAIEVLRRQPDGTWKLVVGDPNGRA
jgi:ketosteroid isomerase-like protein